MTTSAEATHTAGHAEIAGDLAESATGAQCSGAAGVARGRVAAVAVLYAYADGPYAGLDGVDVWDVTRDARTYAGTDPVVAHPPCSRWCRLAGLVEARWGHVRGEDGGTFAHALASVRAWGGVLEHPAYSDAWAAFGLPVPPRHGGWVRGICGGWACHVEQGRYGHAAKKATWLYALGVELPAMRWGSDLDTESKALVSWCGNHTRADEVRPRVGKRAASETPVEMREALIGMARSASGSGDFATEHAETHRMWQRWLARRRAA